MSDHRADIKITFNFHGVDYKYDGWINWSPNDDGIDQRIVDFFREAAEKGYARFDAQVAEYQHEYRERHERESELAELQRLKAKYELAE